MKEIIKFVTEDGQEFVSENDALNHEINVDLMILMPDSEDSRAMNWTRFEIAMWVRRNIAAINVAIAKDRIEYRIPRIE